MIELIRNLCKLIQIIMLILIPLIVIYWVLVQVSLPSFAFLQAILGSFLDPIILAIGTVYSYSLFYEGQSVDMTAFVAIFVLFVIFLVLNYGVKFIDSTEKKLIEIEQQQKIAKERAEQEDIQNKFINDLKSKKVLYLSLIFVKAQNNLSYLLDDNEDKEAEEQIQKIVNFAKKMQGKIVKTAKNENEEFFTIAFLNQNEALNYSFYIAKTVSEINKKLNQNGQNLYYKGVFDAVDNESCGAKMIPLLEQMTKLPEKNQIIATAIFAQKYLNLGENKKIKFNTRGMYSLKNHKYELFDVRIPTGYQIKQQ